MANGEKSKGNNTHCSTLDQNKMVLCIMKTTFLFSGHFSCPGLWPLCGFIVAPHSPSQPSFLATFQVGGRRKSEMRCCFPAGRVPLRNLPESSIQPLYLMVSLGYLYLQAILGNTYMFKRWAQVSGFLMERKTGRMKEVRWLAVSAMAAKLETWGSIWIPLSSHP